MNTFYVQGYTEQQVRDKINELKDKGYKIIGTSIGKFRGTLEYYGNIYYEHI